MEEKNVQHIEISQGVAFKLPQQWVNANVLITSIETEMFTQATNTKLNCMLFKRAYFNIKR